MRFLLLNRCGPASNTHAQIISELPTSVPFECVLFLPLYSTDSLWSFLSRRGALIRADRLVLHHRSSSDGAQPHPSGVQVLFVQKLSGALSHLWLLFASAGCQQEWQGPSLEQITLWRYWHFHEQKENFGLVSLSLLSMGFVCTYLFMSLFLQMESAPLGTS